MSQLSRAARTYALVVAAAGLPCAAALVAGSVRSAPDIGWVAVGALTIALIVAELAPIHIKRDDRRSDVVSVSGIFILALTILAAPAYALLAYLAPALYDMHKHRVSALQRMFAISEAALGITVAKATFAALTPMHFFGGGAIPVGQLPAALAAGCAYIITNRILVGIAYALSTHRPLVPLLAQEARSHFPTHALELGLLPFALLSVQEWAPLVLLLLLPVAAAHRATKLAAIREHEALHDTLTGLPNMQLLEKRFMERRDNTTGDGPIGVLMVGLDDFAAVENVLGKAAGDRLLALAAQRLEANARHGDVVARRGDTTFAVLAPLAAADAEADLAGLGERLLKCLTDEFELDTARVSLQATAGAALAPKGITVTADDLTKWARASLEHAQADDRGTVRFYQDQDIKSSPEQLCRLGELREALTTDQIEVWYQPKVSTDEGRVTGVEALVRWRHPVHGLLQPNDFIPLAERTGLIAPLTWVVLDRALAQVRAWQELGWEIGVAVNFAAPQLLDFNTSEKVLRSLINHNVPARLLTVEVTEGTVLKDAKKAVEVLTGLKTMGAKISMDDYGTGYSSLETLQKLAKTTRLDPSLIDELKIDRAFIKELTQEDNSSVIVASTIGLGHGLGLKVVAEGVEDEATLHALHHMGCDTIQGYLYSPPRPADVLTEWLSSRKLNRLPSDFIPRPRAEEPGCGSCGQSKVSHALSCAYHPLS